jgi:hypothetical protein
MKERPPTEAALLFLLIRMQFRFSGFRFFDQLADPCGKRWIKNPLPNLAVTLNPLVQFDALVTHCQFRIRAAPSCMTVGQRNCFTGSVETEADLLLWRQPSLSHGAFYDVPLSPLAVWAGKRSQVVAQRARLNRRQSHRRTASRALRTLVLCVEHWVSL